MYKLYIILHFVKNNSSDLKLKLYIFYIYFLNCYTHRTKYIIHTHTRTHARAHKQLRTHAITPTYRGIFTYGRKMSGKITQTLIQVTLLASANRRRYWCRRTEDPVDVMKERLNSRCRYSSETGRCYVYHNSLAWASKILLTRFSINEIKIFRQIHERHNITNTTIFK